MDLEMILQKFAVFSGLIGDALQACLPYCRDAMQELLARKRAELTATEPLGSAAAAGLLGGGKFYFGQVKA